MTTIIKTPMTTTAYSWEYNGDSYRREFYSYGSITTYKNGCHAQYSECGWRFIEIYEFQFLTNLASQNIEYTKTVIEHN